MKYQNFQGKHSDSVSEDKKMQGDRNISPTSGRPRSSKPYSPAVKKNPRLRFLNQIQELAEVGYTNEPVCIRLLHKFKGDTTQVMRRLDEATIHKVVVNGEVSVGDPKEHLEKYQAIAEELKLAGYTNRPQCLRMLVQCNGDKDRVINRLTMKDRQDTGRKGGYQKDVCWSKRGSIREPGAAAEAETEYVLPPQPSVTTRLNFDSTWSTVPWGSDGGAFSYSSSSSGGSSYASLASTEDEVTEEEDAWSSSNVVSPLSYSPPASRRQSTRVSDSSDCKEFVMTVLRQLGYRDNQLNGALYEECDGDLKAIHGRLQGSPLQDLRND